MFLYLTLVRAKSSENPKAWPAKLSLQFLPRFWSPSVTL